MGERQDPARAQVRSPLLYMIFNCVFAALFAGIFLLILLNNTHTLATVWLPWLFLAAAAGIVFVLLTSRLFLMMPAPGKKAEVITVAVLFVLLMAAQGVLGWLLRVDPAQSPAYGNVYDYARQLVLHGIRPEGYFEFIPTDAPYFVILTSFFSLLRMFGMTDFTLPSLIVNIVLIDIALFLLYRCARSLFGAKRAIFLLVMFFFTLPLLLYVPILSAETFALPFVVAVVHEWLQTRRLWRAEKKGEAIQKFLMLSAFAALGMLFRTVVLVVWIAVVIDLFVMLSGKARVRLALGGFGILAALVVVCYVVVYQNKSLPDYSFSDGMPVTEQVLEGLDGYGTYNDEDFAAALEQPDRAARSAHAGEEIGARLGDMGALGFLGHLGNKLSYTFEDGTYNASLVLDKGAIQPGALQTYVGYYGEKFLVVTYVSFALQAALLFWTMLAAVKAVIRRNEALTFVRVALFGLVLFLLIFETSPRALVPVVPLFLLCALEASPIVRTPARARRAPGPLPGGVALAEGRGEAPGNALDEAPADAAREAPYGMPHVAALEAPVADNEEDTPTQILPELESEDELHGETAPGFEDLLKELEPQPMAQAVAAEHDVVVPEQTVLAGMPPAETSLTETPPAETPPAETPPAETPPAETPPAETPPEVLASLAVPAGAEAPVQPPEATGDAAGMPPAAPQDLFAQPAAPAIVAEEDGFAQEMQRGQSLAQKPVKVATFDEVESMTIGEGQAGFFAQAEGQVPTGNMSENFLEAEVAAEAAQAEIPFEMEQEQAAAVAAEMAGAGVPPLENVPAAPGVDRERAAQPAPSVQQHAFTPPQALPGQPQEELLAAVPPAMPPEVMRPAAPDQDAQDLFAFKTTGVAPLPGAGQDTPLGVHAPQGARDGASMPLANEAASAAPEKAPQAEGREEKPGAGREGSESIWDLL